MNIVEKCPVCAHRELLPFAMSPWAPSHLHFAQVTCPSCGLIIAQPQATTDEMTSYYGKVFYQEQWPDPEMVWFQHTISYNRYELPMMKKLWSSWPPPVNAAVGEIGCGYGVMLGLLRDAGCQVKGCEISDKAVNYCRSKGLDVTYGEIPGIPLAESSFDVVVAMHVIEHLSDPHSFVKELMDLLRPGGVVVIVTEDALNSQYAWDRFRACVRGRIPPFRSSTDHTYVFQANHLRRLLLTAGCDDVQIKAFSHTPENESLHWRIYKGVFRLLDKVSGHGDFLMAVGHKSQKLIS